MVIHGGFWKAAYDLSLGRPLADEPGRARLGGVEHRVPPGRQRRRRPRRPSTTSRPRSTPLRRPGRRRSTGCIALGHSAGGHLATWAASRGRFDRWPARVDLTGVVSQAGVLDLRSAYDEGLGGGAVAGVPRPPARPRTTHPVDPLRQVPLDVPVHCVHGIDDDVVPISQSRTYVAAATAAGARADADRDRGRPLRGDRPDDRRLAADAGDPRRALMDLARVCGSAARSSSPSGSCPSASRAPRARAARG